MQNFTGLVVRVLISQPTFQIQPLILKMLNIGSDFVKCMVLEVTVTGISDMILKIEGIGTIKNLHCYDLKCYASVKIYFLYSWWSLYRVKNSKMRCKITSKIISYKVLVIHVHHITKTIMRHFSYLYIVWMGDLDYWISKLIKVIFFFSLLR